MKNSKNICIYKHIRLDNNQTFYIGIGYEKKCKKVIDLNTNKIYSSVKEISKFLNISPPSVCFHLKKENNKYNIKYL